MIYGIESFWSTFKRAYHGTYTQVSKKHLQKYLNEFTGRYLHPDFIATACNSDTGSLSYKQLTRNNAEGR